MGYLSDRVRQEVLGRLLRITRRRLAALGWRVPTRCGMLFGKAPLPGAGYRCTACWPPLSCAQNACFLRSSPLGYSRPPVSKTDRPQAARARRVSSCRGLSERLSIGKAPQRAVRIRNAPAADYGPFIGIEFVTHSWAFVPPSRASLRDAQCGIQPPPQSVAVFKSNRDPDEVPRDPAGFGPVQFAVVRQERERTGQREHRSQARALANG